MVDVGGTMTGRRQLCDRTITQPVVTGVILVLLLVCGVSAFDARDLIRSNRLAPPSFCQRRTYVALRESPGEEDDDLYDPTIYAVVNDEDDAYEPRVYAEDNDVDSELGYQRKYIPPDVTVLGDDGVGAQYIFFSEESGPIPKRTEGTPRMSRNKWINQELDNNDYDDSGRPPNKTFRQDFRGTRVFVQGLPPHATWQTIKDHFRIAGNVVFASVSADRETGESKGYGIVQYETTDMAKNAIAIMRNHPLEGYPLFVREDLQENKEGAQLRGMPKVKGPTPPSKWKCANEENASSLSDEERRTVLTLIKARDQARRRRQYEASDNMRDELRAYYGVHIDDRLKMWWTELDGNQVPKKVMDIKGDGRWGTPKAWTQIPTTPENDECVNADLVNALLAQRDIARQAKDFSIADALLNEARNSPDGDLSLRIHDETRTWRVWTDEPPPRPVEHAVDRTQRAAEECMAIVSEHAPERVDEIRLLLEKFKGREYNILKKLRSRYIV